jgi:hypothetical protein
MTQYPCLLIINSQNSEPQFAWMPCWYILTNQQLVIKFKKSTLEVRRSVVTPSDASVITDTSGNVNITNYRTEDDCLLGRCVMWSGRYCPTFQWRFLPSSSGPWRGSKHPWNVSQYLPDYTVQHPRRQPSSYSSPWEPEMSTSWLTPCSKVNFKQLIVIQTTEDFLICKSGFWTLSIVCISIKLRFGSWIFFRLQVKRKDRNPSWPGLRLAQPGGPTARISVLFYLKTEEDPASETL